MAVITKDMTIGQILDIDESLVPILLEAGMRFLGSPAALSATLESACINRGTNVDLLVNKINSYLSSK